MKRLRRAGLIVLASAAADTRLPGTAPLAPADVLRSFHVRDGFCLESLAAEPLVTDLVAAAYDED